MHRTLNRECCVCLKENIVYFTPCFHEICPKCLLRLDKLECCICRRSLEQEVFKYNLLNYLPRTQAKFKDINTGDNTAYMKLANAIWMRAMVELPQNVLDNEKYFYFGVDSILKAKDITDVVYGIMKEDEFQEQVAHFLNNGMIEVNLNRVTDDNQVLRGKLRTDVNHNNFWCLIDHPHKKLRGKVYVHIQFEFRTFVNPKGSTFVCPLLFRLQCIAYGCTYVKMHKTLIDARKCKNKAFLMQQIFRMPNI